MKLFTMVDLYKRELAELTERWEFKVELAEQDWKDYMIRVAEDCKKFHNGTANSCGEELCMWCHYLALARDLGKKSKELECMDFDDPDSPDCIDCLSKAKYWFKRLI